MLSSMETFTKKCTCNHLLAIHTQAVKFAAFVVLFMTLSRLLELGLKSLAQQGFTLSPHDIALFVRRSFIGITLILLYVDDMILTGDDSAGIRSLQHFLYQHFEMKDLGTLSYFLGLKVTSSFDGYYLSQAEYAYDLLSKAGITDNKIVSTPLEYNAKLTPLDGEPISNATRYCQLVGSLIYLIVTRSDISYAMGMVSKFMDAPRFVHYIAVLWILQYVKGTLYHGFHYSSRSSLEFHAYSNADWAGDPTDRYSITSFCFMLSTSLVLWRSKKQDVVSRSSTEVEYHTLTDTTCELVWLCWLLADIDASQPTVTPLYCDNRSAI